MKLVLLADLHGNMTVTEAMEKELVKIAPDDIWFLGDAVVDASTFESYRLPLFYDINKSIDTLRMLETPEPGRDVILDRRLRELEE